MDTPSNRNDFTVDTPWTCRGQPHRGHSRVSLQGDTASQDGYDTGQANAMTHNVACPTYRALPGQPCITKSSRSRLATTAHVTRVRNTPTDDNTTSIAHQHRPNSATPSPTHSPDTHGTAQNDSPAGSLSPSSSSPTPTAHHDHTRRSRRRPKAGAGAAVTQGGRRERPAPTPTDRRRRHPRRATRRAHDEGGGSATPPPRSRLLPPPRRTPTPRTAPAPHTPKDVPPHRRCCAAANRCPPSARSSARGHALDAWADRTHQRAERPTRRNPTTDRRRTP